MRARFNIEPTNMTKQRTLLIASTFLLALSACEDKEISTSLERSTPEREGVTSEAIMDLSPIIMLGAAITRRMFTPRTRLHSTFLARQQARMPCAREPSSASPLQP